MSTKAELHNQVQAAKRDKLSRVISAAMHIIHESHLSGSNLWPEHGFQIGYHGSEFLHDIAYLNAKYWNYPPKEEEDKLLIINMQSLDAKRLKSQGAAIDMIMEEATYDDVLFNILIYKNDALNDRYFLGGYLIPNSHSLQLRFKFTINPIDSSPIPQNIR